MAREKIIGIYKITSPTKKIYIGQSKDIFERIKYYEKATCKAQVLLYHSLKKHGWKAHKFDIIHYCTVDQLNYLEVEYILVYNSFNTKHGLNLISGGGVGRTNSEQTRRRISIANKGNQIWLGKKHTEETKAMMRLNRNGNPKYSGHKMSDEAKVKIGAAQKGKNPSEETRTKMRIAATGRVSSEETRKKLSIANKGRKMSENFKIKMREVMKGNKNALGRIVSEDTRKKISTANSGENCYMFGIKGALNPKSKPVNQYDLKLNLVKRHVSIISAASELGVSTSLIILVCQNKTPSAYGFVWSYEGNAPMEYKLKARGKGIIQVGDDGVIIKEWKSSIEAAKSLGVSTASICRALKGKQPKSGGFTWKYKD